MHMTCSRRISVANLPAIHCRSALYHETEHCCFAALAQQQQSAHPHTWHAVDPGAEMEVAGLGSPLSGAGFARSGASFLSDYVSGKSYMPVRKRGAHQ